MKIDRKVKLSNSVSKGSLELQMLPMASRKGPDRATEVRLETVDLGIKE